MKVEVTDVNFKEEVLESKLPCLVDFWAQWCAPCHMVTPVVEEIAKEYQGRLKVSKVNVDQASNTAANYKIMSIPTLAVFKNGKVVDRVVGVLSKAELEALIKPHI